MRQISTGGSGLDEPFDKELTVGLGTACRGHLTALLHLTDG